MVECGTGKNFLFQSQIHDCFVCDTTEMKITDTNIRVIETLFDRCFVCSLHVHIHFATGKNLKCPPIISDKLMNLFVKLVIIIFSSMLHKTKQTRINFPGFHELSMNHKKLVPAFLHCGWSRFKCAICEKNF